MKRCLDDWLLQAYMDGELSPEQASEAAAHIAACKSCADALRAAQNESSFFAASFAPDETVSVPTEILRARLSAAVAQLESSPESNRRNSRGRSFGGLLTALSGLFTFTPQGAAAFAGLLAILTFATVFMFQKSQPTPNNVQVAQNKPDKPTQVISGGGNSNQIVDGPQPGPTQEIRKRDVAFTTGKHNQRPMSVKNVNNRINTPAPKKEQFLQGEKDYQTAIASLEKTIKMGGDGVLSPSVRVKYERNLAILDSAIGETRRVAAANPKDKDAASFLMSAYQSKVELLTKVAEHAQVAALGR